MKKEAPIELFNSRIGEIQDRVVLVDKPSGITSFDVIRTLRKFSGIRKIGHAGTLDPLATGLLICMTGSTTKLSRHFMDLPKIYTGRFKMGEETASYDSETPVIKSRPVEGITDRDISLAAANLTGDIIQITPIYAAVKVGGKPLYAYAREGKTVTRPPRVVSVYEFVTTKLDNELVDFKIVCSTGTYVRTLAHDIGQALGVGAYLVSLRREAIGQYHVNDALPLNHFQVCTEK